LRLETGFDLHYGAGLAVQFARFSAMAAGEFGIPSPHCRAELAAQLLPDSLPSSCPIEGRVHTVARFNLLNSFAANAYQWAIWIDF
jgi:hypothetical protein